MPRRTRTRGAGAYYGGAAAEGGPQPIVVAGLRPTSDREYKQLEIMRLTEAQEIREAVDDAVREVSKRSILNHGGLRVALGKGYLVKLFECDANTSCIANTFAGVSDRATMVVYGDYTETPDSHFFRFKLIDLGVGELQAEVEFGMTKKELKDRDRWQREMAVLLAPILEAESAAAGGGGGESSGGGESGGGEDTGGPADGGLDDLDALEAELDDSKPGGAGSEGVLVRRFRGSIATELRSFPVDRNGPKKDEQFFVESELELDLRFGKKGTFYFRPRFLMDTLDTDLKRFEPYEGYVQYSGEKFDIRAGQFIDNWGIADAYNPLDVLNRRDYAVDAVDPKPLGEVGVHLRYVFPSASWFGEPTMSIYVMPVWRETLLPEDDYRYSLSQPPFVLVHEPEYPESPEDGIFAALRFEHTLKTPAFSADMQYIGARGLTRFPAITPMPQGDGTVQLLAQYYGTWIGGGGFRLVPNGTWLAKFTFKTEAVYTRPYRQDMTAPAQLPDDYVQYVVGFDRVFDGLLTDLDSLTLTIEYLGEEMADDFMSQFRPFEHDVAARLYYERRDFARLSIELRGVVDVENRESLGEATIGRQLRFIHDDLRFEIMGQGVRPERDLKDEPGFFGFFPNNSNVRARLAFDF